MTLPCGESLVISDFYPLCQYRGSFLRFASNPIQTINLRKKIKSISKWSISIQGLSFLIVAGDRDGEDEHGDHDGEEGDGDEGDHKSCNESTASLQIILQGIRHLVTVTLAVIQDTANTSTTQPAIITIDKVKLYLDKKVSRLVPELDLKE